MGQRIAKPRSTRADEPVPERTASVGGHGRARSGSRAVAMRVAGALAALAMLVTPGDHRAQAINNHPVALDPQGKLLSWLPQDTAYARIVSRVWNGFLNDIPTVAGPGLKAYYLYPYMNADLSLPDWPHSPGGTYAMLADSAILSYPFTGDAAMMAAVKATLTYLLAHGMTGAGDSWASVTYNESNAGSTSYSGATRYGNSIGDGGGVLEPDKVAEVGLALLSFYKFDGTTAFRDQAIQHANILAARRRTSPTASVSPWPFRVRASDNAVVEEYCAHVIAAIKLWDELIRLGLGDTATYQTARASVWNWMMTYPMQNGVWSKYFEDMPIADTSSRNQYLPGNTARHLLEHPELDPAWEAHARSLIGWIETNFGKPLVYGARPIGEQTLYNNEMGSHTSRYGAVNALLYERTGDAAAKEKAYRALNWASYQNRSDGLTLDAHPFPNQIWFTDGFGDYARHFMIAMGAVPEWAPPGESHLLRSTSVVRSVAYSPDRVEYTTFDGGAQEVLRLNFTPGDVLGDGVALPRRGDLLQEGWTFDAATGTLRVRHDRATRIAVAAGASPLRITPSPASTPPKGTVAFAASGGSGAGYGWTLSTNASGGSIDPASGVYTAGPTGSVTDVVQVSDSLGSTATGNVTVTAGVSIFPLIAAVSTGGRIAFTASGGSGSGWAWTLATNASGGSIDATGAYQAGPTGDVTDVVQVVDSLGNSATRSVSVTVAAPGPLTITPPSPTTPPRGSVAFAASGGSGAGYGWTLSTNASGGSVDPASGAYTAGPTGSVTDVVQLSDSLGNSASASVTVTAGVTISPANASVAVGGHVGFTASGGSGGGWAWTLATNASGGSIGAASGAYQAGPTGGVTDVIQVGDSLGNSATRSVAVTVPVPTGKITAGCGCTTGLVGLDVLACSGLAALLRRRRLISRGVPAR